MNQIAYWGTASGSFMRLRDFRTPQRRSSWILEREPSWGSGAVQARSVTRPNKYASGSRVVFAALTRNRQERCQSGARGDTCWLTYVRVRDAASKVGCRTRLSASQGI